MFVHNINPTLLEVGPFEIRYYGLFYVLGFLFVYWYLNKRRELFNLSKKDVDDYIFYVMLGLVIGSRLFHVFVWEPAYYLADPLKILFVWRGGLAFHGGLMGVMLVSYWFCKKKNISFLSFADVLSIPAVFGLALGRLGNFTNGEIWGPESDAPWCVLYEGVCRHPYQLYAFFKRISVGCFLLWYVKRKHADGAVFALLMILLGLGRFMLDFWRVDPRYLGLSTGQYASVFVVLAGVVLFIKVYKSSK